MELACRPKPLGFLTLPAELRNKIYAYALVYNARVSNNLRIRLFEQASHREVTNPSFQLAPALLATCRQVHEEGTPVLYGRNCFLATNLRSLSKWVQRLQSAGTIRYVRKVQVWLTEEHGTRACQKALEELKLLLELAPKIKRLEIKVAWATQCGKPMVSAFDLASMLGPSLYRLAWERGCSSEYGSSLDVVNAAGLSFTGWPFAPHDWAVSYDADFKEALKRLLGAP